MSRLILVGGGARSGKSRFALARARAAGPRRIFVATAEPLDAEMAERIGRHRAERADVFGTIEEPVALAEVLERAQDRADVILVDCLTLWVSNLLVRGAAPDDVAGHFDRLLAVLDRRRAHIVLVTNEVGMGVVPETALGRSFRDHTGLLHQRLSAVADEIYLGVMGTVLRLRPGPVEIAPRPVSGG